MKKTYVIPEVEILALTETECCFEPPKTPKEILSSTGEVVGYEEEKTQTGKTCTQQKSYRGPFGWFHWSW